MRPAIQIEGITKRFGRALALDDLTLTVDAGKVLALLGPNGAGKTTLTRILATLVLPDAGRALVAGHDVVCQPAAVRRSLGVSLSDERSWYWRLSGRRNLEFFARLYGFSRHDAATRTQELLDELGLASAADRRFDGYSAGMKSRLSLARALLPNPPVLLLDEPTRSLDPVAAADFRTRVDNLVHVGGKTVLLTTHNLHEAAALANDVVVLVEGRLTGHVSHGASAEELETLLIAAIGS